MFENTLNGPLHVDYVLSSDDGLTWGSRGTVYTAASGSVAGSPQVVTVGGTVVVSFMTNEDGGTAGAVDGGEMKTVGSTDGGLTYSGPTTVGPLGSHWGGMLPVGSDSFMILVNENGPGMISQLWNV